MLVKNRQILVLSLIVLMAGCASASLFVSYPAQMLPVKQDINNRQYAKAQEFLDRYRHDADSELYMMERGRISDLANDKKSSIEDFKQVIAQMQAQDEKAKLTATGTVAQGSAILLNDNAIPYVARGYERVFVHHFQALNYLFSKDVEAAQVEVRRANEEQKFSLERHEKELAEAEEKGGRYLNENSGFMESFSGMESIAGRVKNSFQNAYTFYVSALIYESQGEYNDAYIDYKKALEIFPDNHYVQSDVLRLAKRLGMRDDYDQFKKVFGMQAERVSKENSFVVVLFEQGFVPPKLEIQVPMFIGNHVQKVAFPVYASLWQDTAPLEVSVAGGKLLGATSPIVYVQALAVKALQENLPAMFARQILRVIAKRNMSERAGKAAGPLAQFATDVFNIISENADRRSWLTLPNEAQILKTALPAGEYQLRLNSGMTTGTMTIRVKPGHLTVVRVVETGRVFHTDAIVI